jgi:Na+-transporting methylmalonyl-CoA/oxaloacetate decarboxylase gamma subunit
MTDLTTALIITCLGMGLVFAMIILLWGLMILLVRLSTTQESAGAVGISQQDNSKINKKRLAAIAAVSVALMHAQQVESHEFPLPPTAIVSAWQAVNRSEIHKKRGLKR